MFLYRKKKRKVMKERIQLRERTCNTNPRFIRARQHFLHSDISKIL